MRPSASSPLLIFPYNGNGLEALDCLGESWHCIGFVDDTPGKQGLPVYGYPVLSRAALTEKPEARVLAVPGGPSSYQRRARVIEGLELAPDRYARVIHPTATVSPRATIGYNVLVMAGAVITSNATIGNHVCILPNTVVHHDCVIGDWTLIGSNVAIAGGVNIGRNCYIATGSSLKHGIRVGAGALIGIGSNVIRDVAAEDCVAGNPARPLRENRLSQHQR